MTTDTVIGLSWPTLDANAPKAMVQGVAHVAEERGAKVLVANADLDGEKQAADIDKLVEAGVDALIVYPTAAIEDLRPAMDRAVAADILLFGHDELEHPATISEFITPAASMSGMSVALLDELLGGEGNICIVGGPPAPQALERTEGFKEAIAASSPGLKIVAEISNVDDVREGAREVMAALLSSADAPALDGVLTYNDASALGAADAIEAAGVEGITIVGSNGEPDCLGAIREGRVAGTVERYPIELGQQAGKIILDILEGKLAKEDAPTQVASEPELITPANVDDFRPWPERTPTPGPETCTYI